MVATPPVVASLADNRAKGDSAPFAVTMMVALWLDDFHTGCEVPLRANANQHGRRERMAVQKSGSRFR
jgi:hypothetical protein